MSDQQPSTSGTNNLLTVDQPTTTRKNDITNNARFNCSSCRQYTLIPNRPVYYLPCLHIICYQCYDKLKPNQPNRLCVCCPKCYKETTRECIFDDFTYDPNRRRCEIPDCKNETVFSKCITCTKYLCEGCAAKHDVAHRLQDSSTYIPMSSRCSTQHTPNRFASFLCVCRSHLCNNCAQTHQCEHKSLTNISNLVKQSIEHMTRVAENDKKMFSNYQRIYDSIQNRRRQIIAEFHNARSSLAHNTTKTASLLVHRFNDIREHLNVLQNSVLSQLAQHEKMIAAEMQPLREVIMLENQIATTKDYNAISFFSFVKAASMNANQSCKHQSYNVDQHVPTLNIRVDTKLPDFCNFLNTIGAVHINGTLSKPKSKFDSSILPMFDVVPKINSTTTSKAMGYSLRTLNGSKHVVVDQEEIRRKVKLLQDPDELRDRCKQLESELVYYKALTNHLETELQNKQMSEGPSTLKASTQSSNSSGRNWPDANNHSSRQPSSAQQQLFQQIHAAANKMSAPTNVQRVQNSHNARRHNLTVFPDPTAIYQQAMHGHPNVAQTGVSATPPYPMQMPSSVPGSPQFNSQNRLSNSAAQSPLTPNQILNSNMLFPRPPHITPHEWQQICMQQQFRQRASQINNPLVNELMRNSIAQLSPTTTQMANIPQSQPRMSSPPAAVGSSRTGSVSTTTEASKSNTNPAEQTNNSKPKPVEVISLSDDEEDGAKQKNPLNNNGSQQSNTNGKVLNQSLSNKTSVSDNQSNENPCSNNSSNDASKPQTPQTDAFNRAFRFMSADNPANETNSVDKNTRSSSVPQQNNTSSSDPKTNSSDEAAKKSVEKPNEAENKESLPPIKLKLRLGNNSLPFVANQPNSTTTNEVRTVESVETEQSGDAWDDFCYICNEGCDEKSGDLGCCSSCPKVFHQYCHVPICDKPMQELPDDWKCGLCIDIEPIKEPIDGFPQRARLTCCRILLLCFKDQQQVEPFKRADFTDDSDAVNLIKISFRLNRSTYENISEFICDMNTLFKNCSRFNAPSSIIIDYCRTLYKIYQDGVRDFLPAYSKELWLYVSLFNKSEVPKKKRKIMD